MSTMKKIFELSGPHLVRAEKISATHPKKVCFRGCRTVHKNNVFVVFLTKFNVLGILVYIYDVEVGQFHPKMFSELSGPQVVLFGNFLITPTQKSGLGECRIFCKSSFFTVEPTSRGSTFSKVQTKSSKFNTFGLKSEVGTRVSIQKAFKIFLNAKKRAKKFLLQFRPFFCFFFAMYAVFKNLGGF